jgi:prepilin-type N-terminal cleavage/methylation domain-containing protein
MRRGFVLLEVVLAIGVFAIAATGFVVALHRTDDLAATAQRELRIMRVLDSALKEAVSLPVLEEGTTTVELEEMGIEIETLIEPMEMENQDGQLLQEMFRILVTAYWFEDGAWQQRDAETWRYARLYQP